MKHAALLIAAVAAPALAQPAGELPPAAWANPPVSFSGPPPLTSGAQRPTAAIGATYKITGARSIRPLSVSDDGQKTYIIWDPALAIPAVFAGGTRDREEIVNGYMRGDQFVIDRIYSKLTFRLDTATATARRKKVRHDER